MPLHPTWPDIAIRLAVTVLAGAIIGFDRGVRGHAAGLRTTILVGLAASLSMIQANLLLSVDGKGSTSFVEMDLMRLPLGILTGVGFIGGGTILKKGDLVTGVTTIHPLFPALSMLSRWISCAAPSVTETEYPAPRHSCRSAARSMARRLAIAMA
ncbi:putative membrane protein YhiD involved in acid resistance [Bradyrhizobium sp. USDA 4473]